MINKKRLAALALAGVISTSFVGCKEEEKKLCSDDFLNHYDNYVSYDVEGDNLTKKYSASSIVIGINKETNEAREFIYYAGEAKNYLSLGIDNAEFLNGLGFIVEIYDLNSGELLYFNAENNKCFNMGADALLKMLEENDFYSIYDLYDLGIEYKDWFTIEEIKEIEEILINRYTKIKRLTNN